LARAKAFLATGKYFWNANNYVWKAEAALRAFAQHLPATYKELQKISRGESIEAAYGRVATISIDYGVSEKADNLLLVPGDFGWSDIGDWEVVFDLSKKDRDKNSIDKSRNVAPVMLDSRGCFLSGGKKLLAVVGIDDVIVVETKRALLIVKKQRAQEVKQLVEELKKRKLEEFL
jgi:mannose-1-phosphate guanylyltransferase